MHSKCLITFTSCHSSLFRKKIFSNFTVLVVKFFNPYQAKVLILYPLKTPETFGFLEFSGEYKIGTLARDGLRHRSCVFFVGFGFHFACLTDYRQISLLIWNEIKQLKYLLIPLKGWEKHRLPPDFTGR